VRAFAAGLGLLLLSACSDFAELTVGADSDEMETGPTGISPEPDAGEEAGAPPTTSEPTAVQVEPDAAAPLGPAAAAAAEASVDAIDSSTHDSGVDAGEETDDGGKTCCERWEEFLGNPPLQPCAELRCTAVIPPPPPRLLPRLDAGLLPPFFDAGFP
jgi:hypothetical protein